MIPFISTLALIGIQIGLNVLSRLLSPKIKRPKPEPFQPPITSSGTPMTRGFGIFESPLSVGYVRGQLEQTGEAESSITRYYAKMQLIAGWGPWHILYDIMSDGRSVGTQPRGPLQSTNGEEPFVISRAGTTEDNPPLPHDFRDFGAGGIEFSINARQIYGGQLEQGGLQGLFMFYPGTTVQPIDPLMAEVHQEFASAYPWLAYARLGHTSGYPEGLSDSGLNQQGEWFYVSANSPQPRPISLLGGYFPNALLGDSGQLGSGANPVEVLYDIFTNRVWGARKPVARFDVPQWTTAAAKLRTEGHGISVPPDAQQSLGDLADDILSHIDGGLVEDPITGLLQLKLARADYTTYLMVINKSNAENFRRGKPLAPQTLNDIQVRYRRFFGGITGNAVEEPVTDEIKAKPIQTDFGIVGGFGSFNAKILHNGVVYFAYAYKSIGNNLTAGATSAFSQRGTDPPVELVLDVEYLVDLVNGIWYFLEGPNVRAAFSEDETDPGWFAGDRLFVSYATDTTFTTFIDDVATAQNLANQFGTGAVQPESFDYTYFVDPTSAQWKADRLRATMSRSIDTFSWEGTRDQSHLTPWDVVLISEPEWGLPAPIAVRITQVNYGTRTSPALSFEGVKDLWGEAKLLSNVIFNPPQPPPPPPPPPMAAIFCLGGAQRIGVQGTNPTWNIEIERADDAIGTGAEIVTPIGGIVGTSTFFDVVVDAGTTNWWRARHILGTQQGAWTAYIACTADDDPQPPGCVLPTYVIEPDETSGMVTLVITDPQGRVTSVEMRHRSGNGAWSEWTTVTVPYCDAATLSATETSRVEWIIHYTDCNGSPAVYTDGYDFVPVVPPPPPPPVSDFLNEVEVVLYAGAGVAAGADEIELPAEGTRIPLTPWKSAEVKTPVIWATSCYVAASIQKADIALLEDTAGAYLVIRGRVPNTEGAVWRSLGVSDTPRIPLDEASLLLMDDEATQLGALPACVAGDWVSIQEEFQGAPLHLAADIVGVNGAVLEEVIITRLSVWLRKLPTEGPPVEPPTPPPPTPNPGSCDTPSSLSMTTGTEEDEGGVDTTWVRGATTASLTIDGGSGYSRIRETLTGLTPSEKYTFYLTVDTNDKPGVDAFLEVVGQDSAVSASGDSVELEATGYTDAVGAIELLWGVENIAGAGGSGELTVDTEDYQTIAALLADGWTLQTVGGVFSHSEDIDTVIKDSGLSSIHMAASNAAWNNGDAWFEKTFSGYPANQSATGTVRYRAEGRAWYANPRFRLGTGATGLSDVPSGDGAWTTLTTFGSTDSSGDLRVQFGINSAGGGGSNWEVWYDGVIEVEVAGAGSFVINFADLGACFGSGKAGPEVTDGVVEPPPPPPCDTPPCEWPPPPVPATRWFGIWNGDVEGTAVWNATSVTLTPKTAVNILNACEDHDTYVWMHMGPQSAWLLNGVFHEPFWRAQMQAMYDDAATRNALLAASNGTGAFSKVRVVHLVFDEPFHATRYGVPIPFATVERCVVMSKTLFPEMETLLRMDPTDSRYTRRMTGLDSLWGEYTMARGPIDSYITSRIDAAAAWPHYLYFGIHYKEFEGPNRASPRYITAAELRHYGRDRMAAQSSIRGMGGWRYESGLWTQSGFPDAAIETRDALALSTP